MGDTKELLISDYFRYDYDVERTNIEQKKIDKIRHEIDLFYDEADCAKYIYKRRNYGNWRHNRQEDENLFGIPFDAEIQENYYSKENIYYTPPKKGEKVPSLDYNKKDKGFDLTNNKIIRTIRWIAANWHLLLIISIVILCLIATFFFLLYVLGAIDSIGHTPFVLCG